MKTVLNYDVAHQKYFEEMTKIPHGSFNETAYSAYLCTFAKEKGLAYKQDELNNVIIYKPASKGYEDHAPVILQAHMDMVCEKNKDVAFDFEKDALKLVLENGELRAEGTTLGADNGVGVAYMLAILEDMMAKHPALECVFTVQEEVGLFGALGLKKEDFKATRLINLDDGGETSTCITSAGGMNVIFKKPNVLIPCDEPAYSLEVKGLMGGHSGGEINSERGNANKLLTRVLYGLNQHYGIQLVNIAGGIKDNAIPREAQAIFVSDKDEKKIMAYVDEMFMKFKKELEFSDAKIALSIEKVDVEEAMSIEDSEDLLKLLMTLPNGLRHHSMSIEGLSVASSNLGVIRCLDEIEITCSLRGALESYIDTFAMEMDCLAETFGFETSHEARYPAWSYDEKSDLRDVMKRVCHDIYGSDLELVAVHGGLECGVFKAMEPTMDIVTMGPKMRDIHTPNETLDMASFDRTFVFLKTLLENL